MAEASQRTRVGNAERLEFNRVESHFQKNGQYYSCPNDLLPKRQKQAKEPIVEQEGEENLFHLSILR